MTGLDCLGADEVGFDYMSLLKGGAGLLSGAGEMLSDKGKGGGGGGGGGGGAAAAAAAAEKQRLQDEKERAERSAQTMKTVLIVLGSLTGAGLLAFALGRK